MDAGGDFHGRVEKAGSSQKITQTGPNKLNAPAGLIFRGEFLVLGSTDLTRAANFNGKLRRPAVLTKAPGLAPTGWTRWLSWSFRG